MDKEWMNGKCVHKEFIYTGEFYSIIEKHEIVSFAGK
jgi:hypothetical protein